MKTGIKAVLTGALFALIAAVAVPSLAGAYNYPPDDGLPVTTYAEGESSCMMGFCSPPREDSALCKDKRQFFNAVVYVKYVDLDGNTMGYSKDFSFDVQAFDPYPTRIPNDRVWTEWNAKWNRRNPPNHQYPNVLVTQVHTITTTSGAQRTHGPGPVRINRPLHDCSPPSLNDKRQKEKAYAFRTGQNGTYQLSCVGDSSRYSAGFRFTTAGEPRDIPENLSGEWVQPRYDAVPFDYNPNGGPGNLKQNDLNRAFMSIEFKYRVNKGGRTPEYNLVPNLSINDDPVIDGEEPEVKDIESRLHNEGPDGSEDSIWNLSRFIVKRGEYDAARFTQADRPHSNPDTATREYVEGHLRGVEYNKMREGSGSFTATVNREQHQLHGTIESDRLGDSLEVGDRICYMLSIQNPRHDTTNNDWRHGEPLCVGVGIRPHMQVRSGDLMVGGNIYSGSTTRDGQSYGSWGEYGVFAGGSIANRFSSGAQHRMGSATRDSVGYLTYANTPSNMGGFGSITNGTGRLASHFIGMESTRNAPSELNLASLSEGKHVMRPTGNIRVRGELRPNTSVIVLMRANQTALINGNVTTPQTYATVGDISQLVIAPEGADTNFNINIAPNVSQVDAWLLAPAGRVDTCNGRASSNESRVAPFRGDGPESCGNSLFINGPVAANALLLGRTGGQDRADGTLQQALPAENFNLRPDAYLWISNQVGSTGTRYTTTQSLDLPPRY